MNLSIGLHLAPQIRQYHVCATCKRPITENTGRPPFIIETGTVSLVGCVILGICPSCHCYGLDDEALRLMLRRLDRPRAPMRFSRQEITQAKDTLKNAKR